MRKVTRHGSSWPFGQLQEVCCGFPALGFVLACCVRGSVSSEPRISSGRSLPSGRLQRCVLQLFKAGTLRPPANCSSRSQRTFQSRSRAVRPSAATLPRRFVLPLLRLARSSGACATRQSGHARAAAIMWRPRHSPVCCALPCTVLVSCRFSI